MTIVDFLLARIAEDEAAAREVPFEHAWTAHPDEIGQPIKAGRTRIATCADSVMSHIARHDPARALAECQAKRAIIAEWQEGIDTDDPDRRSLHVALAHLAAVYDTHPDYQPEWRP